MNPATAASELTQLPDPLLKLGIAIGILFFIVKELLKIVWYFIKKGSTETEGNLKETSRQKIHDTNRIVGEHSEEIKNLKPAFYEMKNQVDETHEIISEKQAGVPLVYNKGLETAVNNLNQNLAIQATAIERLSTAINKNGNGR